MKLLKLVPDNTNLDFMGWRNIALILSIIVTIASLVIVGVRGLNLGVDFVGGQMIRTTFTQPIDVDQLRSRVGALNLGDASIQEAGGPRTYQIRLPKPEGGEAAANDPGMVGMSATIQGQHWQTNSTARRFTCQVVTRDA
jgi:preprotein translocase subunit SecF